MLGDTALEERRHNEPQCGGFRDRDRSQLPRPAVSERTSEGRAGLGDRRAARTWPEHATRVWRRRRAYLTWRKTRKGCS